MAHSSADVTLGIFPSRKISSKFASLSIRDACLLARSGDIVLISDKSFNAGFINWFCGSMWSHVAIIYRDSEYRDGRPHILEAVKHLGKEEDVIKGVPISGVRLIDFESYLKNFSGNSVSLKLLMSSKQYAIHTELNARCTDILRMIIAEHHGKPYESRWLEIIFARFPYIPRASETLDAFFCSELVAWCYINFGIIDKNSYVSSQFLPEDFGDTGKLELMYPRKLLPFTSFFPDTPLLKLGDEMFIDTALF